MPEHMFSSDFLTPQPKMPYYDTHPKALHTHLLTFYIYVMSK